MLIELSFNRCSHACKVVKALLPAEYRHVWAQYLCNSDSVARGYVNVGYTKIVAWPGLSLIFFIDPARLSFSKRVIFPRRFGKQGAQVLKANRVNVLARMSIATA